jgi:hypothetical protein
MSIGQLILEKLRTLSPEKQREVLDFIEFLQQRSVAKPPCRSLRGLWADLGIQISERKTSRMTMEVRRNDQG